VHRVVQRRPSGTFHTHVSTSLRSALAFAHTLC
jgi:hypothetical protein